MTPAPVTCPKSEDYKMENALYKEIDRLKEINKELVGACQLAKKHLEPDLIEPGRTVFWKLVSALAKAGKSE